MYAPLVCRFGVLARFIQIQTDTDAPEHGSACYRVPVGLVITPATWVRVPTRLRADILITLFARIELGIQLCVRGVTAIFADARGLIVSGARGFLSGVLCHTLCFPLMGELYAVEVCQ